MKPVTYEHKEYRSVVRHNPQTHKFIVYLYRNGELIECQTFSDYDTADNYAYLITIIEDLCDRLGLR